MTARRPLAGAMLDTPTGPMSMVVDGDGRLLACGFTGDLAALLGQVPPDLRADRGFEPRRELGGVTRAVTAYFAGDLDAIDAIEVLVPTPAPFRAAVWAALRRIPAGQSISYTDLATLAGRPAAVRAAASACATNRVALVVPCHRVQRSDGSPGGYGWGLPIKQHLLDHERATRSKTRCQGDTHMPQSPP